jgi:hypothetical protein
MSWGVVVPRLYAVGWTAQRLVSVAVPLAIVALVSTIVLGPGGGPTHWTLFCVVSTATALSQPAVGQAFPAHLAGRALSAYNLIVFAGVFTIQWGIGVAIDAFRATGYDTVSAYRGAFALLALCCALSYVWFLWRDDRAPQPKVNDPVGSADNSPPCLD